MPLSLNAYVLILADTSLITSLPVWASRRYSWAALIQHDCALEIVASQSQCCLSNILPEQLGCLEVKRQSSCITEQSFDNKVAAISVTTQYLDCLVADIYGGLRSKEFCLQAVDDSRTLGKSQLWRHRYGGMLRRIRFRGAYP